MYDFVNRVVQDLQRLRRILSNRELRKLVDNFRDGVETINLLCLRIVAREKVTTDMGRELHIVPEEREEISDKIRSLTNLLNELVLTEAMEEFFRKNPDLAKHAYIKLEAEGVNDYAVEEKLTDEEENVEFLQWINGIASYTKDLLSELDEAVEKTF
jgi:hypothetical protein